MTDQQQPPGSDQDLTPTADHGEQSYRGSGKLTGKRAVITGGDSGIGKAVAIAFAREGADVLISYLPQEEDDAQDTKRWIEEAGRKAVLLPGDVSDPAYCRQVIATAVEELGGLDVLVNNAAYQMTHETIEEISDEEWDHTLATNLSAYFHLVKAALPHLGPGSAIIGSSSVNSDDPKPDLAPYDVTKAGVANLSAALAQLLGPRGIRVNGVAPGPIWTPLQVSGGATMEKLEQFGGETPLGRPGQPGELASIYVQLAARDASYATGQVYGAAGGGGQP